MRAAATGSSDRSEGEGLHRIFRRMDKVDLVSIPFIHFMLIIEASR
jgi:hypothetical protein